MDYKEKISRLLAENYFQAASSDCDMFKITEILEEVREITMAPKVFKRVEEHLETHLGENLEHENEFGIIQRVLEQLREFKREIYKKEILEIFRSDEQKGWIKWLTTFALELSKANNDCLRFLLTLNLFVKQKPEYRNIKKLTPYVLDERWAESLPLFEFFLDEKEVPDVVKADLQMLAGQIHLYHFWDFPKTLEHFKKVKSLIPNASKSERIFGELYTQKAEYKKARIHLQKALDLDKNDFENYVVLGGLYKAENNYETAESWYNEGLRKNPGKADLYDRILLLNENEEYYKKNNSNIKKLVETIIKLDSSLTFTALSNAGFVHQKTGNFEKAEAYYSKAIDLFPNRIQCFTNLGYYYLEKKELQKSEEAFNKSIEIDSRAFDGYWGLVALNKIKKDWKAVISNLKFCEKYRPEWLPYIYNDHGNAWEKLNEPLKAQKNYLLALKNDPLKNLGLDALVDIAELDLAMKEGILLLKKISRIKGSDFDGTFNYRTGVIYYKNLLYSNAISYFEKASLEIQNDPAKLEYAGLAYEKNENFVKAEDFYRKAISAATNNKSKYFNRLAFFLTNIKRCDEAIKLLHKAIELKPEPLYYENIGYAYEILGDTLNAELYYQKAVDLAKEDKDIYENRMGILFYNQGINKKAIEHYNKAIAWFPKAVYFENIGLAYENAGEMAKAETSYRQALEHAITKKDKYYNRLGFFLSDRKNYTEAIKMLLKAVEINAKPTYLENLGFSLEQKGKFDEAQKYYQKALDISTNEKDVYLNRLGVFCYKRKNYDEAITYYKKAISVNPKAIYYENLGNAYLDTSDIKHFEEAFLGAIERNPKEGKYYFQLGWRILTELKDTKKARTYLNKAITIYKETPEIEPEELLSIQFLGAAYQQEGDLDKAEEIFKEAFKLDSENDLICNFLGRVYFKKEDYNKALEYFERAHALKPEKIDNVKNIAEVLEALNETEKVIRTYKNGAKLHPELYENIGKIYFKKEDYVNAEKYIRLAINVFPENYYYLENLGLVMQKQQKHNEAIKSFEKGLKLAPAEEQDIFINYMGNSWYALKEMKKAAEHYTKAIKFNPNNPIYFDNLILALSEDNQTGKAIELIEQRLEKDPENNKLVNQLGMFYFKTSVYEKAIECFKKNIKINPADSIAYDNLGYSFEKINQPENAIDAYLNGAPYDGRFYEKAGTIYFNNKDYENAEKYIRKVNEIWPDKEIYLGNLGIVLVYQNKVDEAEEVYQKLIDLYPGNPIYYESLSKIKDVLGKMEDATFLMNKAVEIEVKVKDKYLFQLGMLYQKMTDNEKAKDNFKAALEIYPGLQYFDALGKLLFSEEEYEKASEVYLKAIQQFPNDAVFIENFNKCFLRIDNADIKNSLYNEVFSINGIDKSKLISLSEN